MRALSFVQIDRLRSAMDPRYRSPVDVLAYGGLRIGEAAGLRPKDVDLDRGRLHIVQAIAEVEGKIHVQDPKTRQRRTVTLDADTVKRFALTWTSTHRESTSSPPPRVGLFALETGEPASGIQR